MPNLQTLLADVAQLKAADDKILAVLVGVKDQLAGAIAGNDPAALQAIHDDLVTEIARLNAGAGAPVDGGGPTP